MDLGQNRILTGNHTKSEGLIVSIDANGGCPINGSKSQYLVKHRGQYLVFNQHL
jgi:hypothetical protein